MLAKATLARPADRLARAFPVIAFDWDGTAVPDRHADATEVAMAIDGLLRVGVTIVVLTGTRFAHVDRPLATVIRGPHKRRLYVSTNRGSELWTYDASAEPALLERREATPVESQALDRIADRVVAELPLRDVAVVRDRLNRRKINLVPGWDPPKSRIVELVRVVEERLAAAGWQGGIGAVVERTRAVAAEEGLADARVTSDGKHVEVGLTDKADAMAAIVGRLGRGEEMLILGDEFGSLGGVEGSDARMCCDATRGATFVSVGPEPGQLPPEVMALGGGPELFRRLLIAQAAQHSPSPRRLALPRETEDPVWVLREPGFDLVREHEIESWFTVGNGALGVRGALSDGSPLSTPGTRLAGVFVRPRPELPPLLAESPEWTDLDIRIEGVVAEVSPGQTHHHARSLDMAQGILRRRWDHTDEQGRLTRMRFSRAASLADRRVALEHLEVTAENWDGCLDIEAKVTAPPSWEAPPQNWEPRSPVEWAGPTTFGFATHPARRRVSVTPGMTWHLDRAVVVGGEAPHLDAERILADGTDTAFAEHAEAWGARVAACAVTLEGDTELQRALHFGCHHLIAAANPENERVSVGARALTGPGYMGHVFWDTELWLAPFYTLTWPRAARALAMYRWHTLPAARARARAFGFEGAMYAWESADTGEDVTPTAVRMPNGVVVPVRNGELEHHVTGAVAWAAWQYWHATHDVDYLAGPGAEVLVETARFWASRARFEPDGRFHIHHVIGPDEYHEDVDDNAYTNALAAWNLRCGAEVARRVPTVSTEERQHWEDIATRMYTGQDARGLFEQFAGYFDLEDIPLQELEPRTAPIDVILGQARVQGSQLIKQADVVMLLALFGHRLSPEVKEANYRYYEARCAQGSSLSPSVHAWVAGRLGMCEMAARYLRQTAAIDLHDPFGNAASGVHIGALGGLWQAVTWGLGGLDVSGELPVLEPRLPPFVRRLCFPFEWRQRRWRAEIDRAGARLVPRGEP